MANFKIKGKTQLSGKVKISGAKNEALKLIPFSCNLKSPITITNVPYIEDVKSQISIFNKIGGKSEFSDGTLYLDPRGINSSDIRFEESKKLRASIVYIGALLARFGEVKFPFPGGCAIGARPIDTHIKAFEDLGAEVIERDEDIHIKLSKPKNSRIKLKEKSVSATENILIYLSGVSSEADVLNCAIEPEIIDLVQKIMQSGANISIKSDRSFKVRGSDSLHLDHEKVIPDRIEAGTFVIALLASGGQGEVYPYIPDHLEALTNTLVDMGAKIRIEQNKCFVESTKESFKPFRISTAPYPGFPTDLQSPMALLALKSKGESIIKENMFESRLKYLDQLAKMGLSYNKIDKNSAVINGPVNLKSTEIDSLDLRSGITLLLAATQAEGESIIHQAEIIDRGYENIEEKLKKLGAKIEREDG